MYTIRQASLRSGVSVPTISAWERRYGVVRPGRTPAGYRLYDEPAIGTLVRMRRLVADGWTPSAAAAALRDGSAPATDGPLPPWSVTGASLVDRFVDAATHYDRGRLEATLDEMMARGSFEATVDSLVLPAAMALGERWECGELDVAAEHVASAAIMRRLSAAFEAASAAGGEPTVVVGLPPGARHELGALAFATALRRRGMGVVYLGSDIPIRSWVHAVGGAGATGAAIGVVRAEDVAQAAEVAEAIHASTPMVTVALGGRAAGSMLLGFPAVRLPDQIVEAAEAMHRAVE